MRTQEGQKMSAKPFRVHRETVAPDMAAALLNIPCKGDARHAHDYSSVGERLKVAREELASAVKEANATLEGNPLAEILAEHVARQNGRRRGKAVVRVDTTGAVLLEVQYGVDKATPPPGDAKKVLPPIVALRQEALTLGIDPLPFGKGKIRLMEAIAAKKAGHEPVIPPPPVVEPPKPTLATVKKVVKPTVKRAKPKKPRKRAVPKKPPPAFDDEEDLDFLFADDKKVEDYPQDGYCSVCGKPSYQTPSGATCGEHGGAPTVPVWPVPAEHEASEPPKLKPKPRPRRGTPRQGTSPVAPKKFGGRSLSALVVNADAEVDVEAILAKEQPPPPKDD